jgi:hypothetical protein
VSSQRGMCGGKEETVRVEGGVWLDVDDTLPNDKRLVERGPTN